jgi:Apea-like HEPN
MPTSFSFILNPLNIEGESSPIQIMPNCLFQKANDQQIAVLKSVWTKLPANSFWLNSYEYDYGVLGSPNKESVKLERSEWKYWVITQDGYISIHKISDTFFVLERSLALLKNDLEIGPLFYERTGSHYKWNPRGFYNYFLDYPSGGRPATLINREEVKEIGTSYTLLKDFYKKMHTITIFPTGQVRKTIDDYYYENFQHIEIAIRQFIELKALPRYSTLTIIGLFSILESLITHHPRQPKVDSISRQIRRKIPLLRSKFQRPLDYQSYFDPASEEDIWTELYKFRSKIVHEGKENIEGGNILRNLESVTDFLKETVKLLILYALNEPQAITDLQAE